MRRGTDSFRLRPSSLVEKSVGFAFLVTLAGFAALVYHADSPPSAFCAVELVLLPMLLAVPPAGTSSTFIVIWMCVMLGLSYLLWAAVFYATWKWLGSLRLGRRNLEKVP